uniref:SDR family NAD(P)-dependent oxidoreductase n=1 Tax=Mycobacterium sp. TaxID=1785 RepID=UPI0031DC1589
MLPNPGNDRAAVVTGASSGIGACIARELARRGHQVVLVARRADKLADLAGQLGARTHVVPADLARRDERAALADRLSELGLFTNVLVNNAGLSTVGPVAQSDVDAELNLVEVDVAAVVDLCSRLVPAMVEARSGAVLNVGSVGSFGPLPGQASYAAAKAFVLSYTRALREELRGSGVTAAALCPGPVHTGFGEAAGFGEGEAEALLPKFLWVSPERVAAVAVDGLAAGRAVIVPGVFNRAATAIYH